MAELGIDISRQERKTLDRYLDQRFDQVITVCGQANEAYPVFFGARERRRWSFPDPSTARGSEPASNARSKQAQTCRLDHGRRRATRPPAVIW
jgi:arsenate reductase